MKSFKRIGSLLLLLSGLAGWGVAPVWGDNPVDVSITVTPVATVSLELETTTYAFGAIDLNTSTNTAKALRLNNSGQVTVTIDKRITSESTPAGWTAGATSGHDQYALYVATSTTRLAISDFTASSLFGTLNNVTPLTGPLGTAPHVPPVGAEKSLDLWFRLDMPNSVSNLQSRSISVRFTATAD
jgi:hypothetical protein